jgi:hypothetical protein
VQLHLRSHARVLRVTQHPLPPVSLSSRTEVSIPHLQILVHRRANSLLIRAHNFLNLLAVLEQQKRRHGSNVEFLRDIGHLVDVNLVEFDAVLVLVFGAHGGDLGGDHLARAAPGGEAVEQDEVGRGAADDGGLEGGFAG